MDVLKKLNEKFSMKRAEELSLLNQRSDKFERKLIEVIWFNTNSNYKSYYIPKFLERNIRKFDADFDMFHIFKIRDGIVYSGSYPAYVKIDLSKCGVNFTIEDGTYALNPYSNQIQEFRDKSVYYDSVIATIDRSLKNLSEIRWFSFSKQDEDNIYGLPLGRRFIPSDTDLFYDKYKLNLAMQFMSPFKHKFYFNEEKSLILKNANVCYVIEGDYVE